MAAVGEKQMAIDIQRHIVIDKCHPALVRTTNPRQFRESCRALQQQPTQTLELQPTKFIKPVRRRPRRNVVHPVHRDTLLRPFLRGSASAAARAIGADSATGPSA